MMACVNPETAATSASKRRAWDRLLIISEVAVIVGSILVVVGLFFEDWVAKWLTMGEALVIVGVALETLADGAILLAARKLQTIQEKELQEMQLETAQANARSAEANQKAQEAVLELTRLRAPIEPCRIL